MLTFSQAAQVDLTQHLPAAWVDAHDDVLIPNIGIHFTLDVFQLVKLFYRLPRLANLHRSGGLQGLWIEEIQRGAAIRKDEAVAVGCQPQPSVG